MAKKTTEAQLTLATSELSIDSLLKNLAPAHTSEDVVLRIGVLLENYPHFVGGFLNSKVTFPESSATIQKVDNAAEFAVAQEAYKQLKKLHDEIEALRKEANKPFSEIGSTLMTYQKHLQEPFASELARLNQLCADYCHKVDRDKQKRLEDIKLQSEAETLANQKLLGLEQEVVDFINAKFDSLVKKVDQMVDSDRQTIIEKLAELNDSEVPDEYAMLANKYVLYYQQAWQALVDHAFIVADFNAFIVDDAPTWSFKVILVPDIDLSGVDATSNIITELEPTKGVSKKLVPTVGRVDSDTLTAVTKAYVATGGNTDDLVEFMLKHISKKVSTDNPPSLPNIQWTVEYSLTAR